MAHNPWWLLNQWKVSNCIIQWTSARGITVKCTHEENHDKTRPRCSAMQTWWLTEFNSWSRSFYLGWSTSVFKKTSGRFGPCPGSSNFPSLGSFQRRSCGVFNGESSLTFRQTSFPFGKSLTPETAFRLCIDCWRMRCKDKNTFIGLFFLVFLLLRNEFSLHRSWLHFISNRLKMCIESTSTCVETTLYRNDRKPISAFGRKLRHYWILTEVNTVLYNIADLRPNSHSAFVIYP